MREKKKEKKHPLWTIPFILLNISYYLYFALQGNKSYLLIALNVVFTNDSKLSVWC